MAISGLAAQKENRDFMMQLLGWLVADHIPRDPGRMHGRVDTVLIGLVAPAGQSPHIPRGSAEADRSGIWRIQASPTVQARMRSTTWPATSVRRRFRP